MNLVCDFGILDHIHNKQRFSYAKGLGWCNYAISESRDAQCSDANDYLGIIDSD